MALGKTVSAASCGVNAVGMLESVERRGLRGSCEDACPREPAEDRIRDLLSFLDRTASNSLHCDGTTHTKPHPPAEATSNANLLSKISALEVELEDKEHSLKALRQLREREKLKAEHTRNQLQFQLREEMTKTTEKYERQATRQQELLNQLQDEKKDATLRCDRLTDEMRELERKFGAKIAELHKQYGRELERQRKAFLSGEKARREAWERDRAQEIKEITIKGLEPEIQRLIDKHRNEKRCLEEKLKKIANEMRGELEQEFSSQKTAVTRQLQEAFEVERSQHRQEIRDLQERFGAQLRKERELLIAKHQEEATKLEAQIKDGKKSMEGAIMKAREEEKLHCKQVASQLAAEMDRMRQNHVAEVQKAAEAAKAKEHETIKALEAAKVAAVQEAVAVTRRDVEAECHRKLDHLLERLSHEQLEVQARFEHQCNEAVAASQASAEQMRQEFIKEREKLESELKAAHEKRLGLERHISRLETEAELKEKLRAELQTALDEASGRAQAMLSETDTRTQALKSEWERDKQQCEQQRQELEAQKEMLDSVSSELSKARKEMEEMKQKETERLETLEAKVKEALYAKDQTIQRLKDELSASNTKVEHLRGLMNRQRTELIHDASVCDPIPVESAPSTSASLVPSAERTAAAPGVKSHFLSQQHTEQVRRRYARIQTSSKFQPDQKTIQKKLLH